MKERFDETDLPNFEPDGKVGLIASIDPEGLPHITLITAMQATDTSHLIFGQFCEGRGKRYAEARKKLGFLFLSLDKRVWRGTAAWTRKAISGPEHELMNKHPMWRYNSYFGLHTVHYLDVVSASSAEPIAMGSVLAGALKATLAKGRLGASSRFGPTPHSTAMNAWTSAFISKTGNLKFIAWVGDDGYPRVAPQLAAVCVDSGRAYVPGVEYRAEVASIPDGAVVALFTMSLSMEDVLVRGTFRRDGSGGVIDVDWVYNSMPPVAERIYPPLRLSEKVSSF